MTDSVLIGDRVRWESAGGTIRGEVVDIRLGLNGELKLAPWLMVEHVQDNRTATVALCGSHENLAMMKFRVTFRDRVVA